MKPRFAPLFATVLVCFATLLCGCSTYGERVAPVPLPSAQPGAIQVDGASIIARGYADATAAEQAFGFDVRAAGLLPVQFVIDNQSGKEVSIQPQQTLLLDREDNAWPLLSSDMAADRVRATVSQGETIKSGAKSSLLSGLAGAIAGAAVGVVTGENVGNAAGKGAVVGAAAGSLVGGAKRYSEVGRDVENDLEQKSLRNRTIKPGELAYGFLFFPGKDEAQSTRAVRLSLRIGDKTHIVQVPANAVVPRQ